MAWVRGARSPGGLRGLLGPILGGALLAASFPPLRAWPLVFVAWVPLWMSLHGELGVRAPHAWRRAFFQGWLMGFVGHAGILHWILALSNEEVTIPGLMVPSLALIALYLGCFGGLAALALRWVGRRGGAFWLLAPIVVTLGEYLRSLGPLGFPWGAPGYALARATPLLQVSATLGFWGLVMLILAVNALLGAALAHSRQGAASRVAAARVWWGPLGAAVFLALWWAQGASVLARHPHGSLPPDRDPLRVLVAQPDIRREIKWKPEKHDLVVDLVMDHAREAAARARAHGGYDLFVWPETVLPSALLNDEALHGRVRGWLEAEGRPVLLGLQEAYVGEWRGKPTWITHNSALVLHPGGGRSTPYRKLRLVPFSERFPLQEIIPWIGALDFGQSNFFPGDSLVTFAVPAGEGSAVLGCLICFESAFPEVARGLVRRGAGVLVNITNDFWFERSAGPWQHAEMAIHRAVENRTPLVRCANTGVSFVVDPWGRVSHATELFTRAAFVGVVAAGAGSFSACHPDWVLIPLAVTAALVAAGAARGAKRRRR